MTIFAQAFPALTPAVLAIYAAALIAAVTACAKVAQTRISDARMGKHEGK
jgi:hypothetical protein